MTATTQLATMENSSVPCTRALAKCTHCQDENCYCDSCKLKEPQWNGHWYMEFKWGMCACERKFLDDMHREGKEFVMSEHYEPFS